MVDYPATLAAERERLIDFRCVIGKKRVAKKNIITKDGVNRIPTSLKAQHSQYRMHQTAHIKHKLLI